MNAQSHRIKVGRVAALVALVAIAFAALPAAAQPQERGPWDRLDLTEEQRAQVREIVKEHRDASREELHKKLASVLSEEQLAQLEKKHYERPGMRRGGKGMHRKRGHGMRGRGDCGSQPRNCNCCCGDRGAMRGGRGGHGHGGPGPHMGAMRGERAGRMIERLTVVLDLTEDQLAKVKGIVEEHQKQFDAERFDRSKLTFEERQKTRDAHRILLANRIKEVLTDDQKDKYDEWLETMPGPRGRGGRRAR
jgi:Spy/CpxP family protein refolding chaperone